jgi:adenylate cyclase
MGIEIERKFLVCNGEWRAQVQRSQRMQQAYLSVDPQRCIRVRISGDQAHINLKSSQDGVSRHEYEYAIPLQEAEEILTLMSVGSVIDKTRHFIPAGDLLWEVDEFHGDNDGLIVAEIELTHPQQTVPQPAWLGQEVSEDSRVYNMNLAMSPYCRWRSKS